MPNVVIAPHLFNIILFYCCRYYPYLHSFPTRRSSDLIIGLLATYALVAVNKLKDRAAACLESRTTATDRDRKSTRLNSSHDQISYAVFCLKKKKLPRSAGTISLALEAV